MTKDPDRVPPEERTTDEHLTYDYSQPERASAERATAWPRRNSKGRITTFRHFLEVVAVLLVIGILAVGVIDLLSTWVGIGELGGTSGWLGGLMAFWLYVEEFRAWRGTRSRLLMALAGGVLSFGLGIVVTGLLSGLPSLISGAAGVAAAALVYAPTWFFGIRQLADREADQ
ncbi:MAG TPA: hypothetical protein VFZ32_16955 [Micromonosporaceae bacterium]